MSGTPAAAAPGAFEPGMFRGPRVLRPLTPVLRRVPRPLAAGTLAGLAIADGLCRRRRFLLASEWAAALGRRGVARWRLAFALLANHGRFVAEEMMLGVDDLADLRQEVVIEGADHLRAGEGGRILLGFHLGPPRTAHVLQAFGHPVRSAGRLQDVADDARWAAARQAGAAVRLPGGIPLGRAQGLHRIRLLLKEGAFVYLTADGPFGREAFRIEVPGRDLVVRVGWLMLRRFTRAPVHPVLSYREGGRRVIVVHPPLPVPEGDPANDAEVCRAALTPLIQAYVAAHPEQCRYLAFPRWERPA
jgi:lauroyl/myristoyl acyltransferase